MKNNELKVEYIEIEKLTPFKGNSKIHTQNQIRHIANSIETFGFNDPLGICGEDNVVLEGNGRIEAAKLLCMKTLPCVRLDHLSEDERRAYVIAHNTTSLETGFDEEILKRELEKLQNYNFGNYGLDSLRSEEMMKQLTELQNIQDDYYKNNLVHQTKNLVRKQFLTTGNYDIPIIKKQEADLNKIKLMSFTNTRYCDLQNNNRTIHFFCHDYRFEYAYSQPELAAEKLKQYFAMLSPDFSTYTDMPLLLQMCSIFKNRWCGAYWQSLGLTVIPTISWSDERSFSFCFDGIEEGSIVAVSTHGNNKVKERFMRGYNEMLLRIKPCAIICYGKPFPEMTGNMIAFPYNRNESKEITR